jgi:hypothetical protein
MPLRLLTVFTAVLAVLAPRCAVAAAPADVDVRVEGDTTTLVERTAIRTDVRTVNKDGVAGHDCTGTSAAGALEIATAGDWGGDWSAFGYGVKRIRGETHDFTTPDFFSLWINDKVADEGVCGTTSELEQGDSVLFFVARCVYDPAIGDCSNEPVLPLGLTAPKLVQPGVPFDVSVVQYSTKAVASPVAGATVVDGGVALGMTNGAGVATITLSTSGPRTLKATKLGGVRSAAEPVCATTGADGLCASATATPEPVPVQQTCESNGCGMRDLSAPTANIRSIADGRRFGRGFGPRELRVGVDPDPSGLLAVKLRLTRTDHGRCSYFSGTSERFVVTGRGRCRASDGFWFAVGNRRQTSYLLPARLPRGRYVLDANAIDKAYNRDDQRRRGANRVVFHVG